jgi:putative spermidine/putrescine transport system substrate-binding protein
MTIMRNSRLAALVLIAATFLVDRGIGPLGAQSQAEPPPPDASRNATENDGGSAKPSGGPALSVEAEAKSPDRPAQAGEPVPASAGPVTLRVATWGGAYAQAQAIAFFEPFGRHSGHTVETLVHDGSYEALVAQAERDPKWDVADLSAAVARRACDAGLIEQIDAAQLGAEPADFIPGALMPCGIGSVAWSALVMFNADRFAKRPPGSLRDMFNPKSFPGKRSLPNGPRYTLELALMADGVEPANVYSVLETAEGQVRALNMLNQIKAEIVWWNDASEPVARVAGGEAAFGLGFNGRAFHAIAAERQPLRLIWDGQIYDLDYWVLPKAGANRQAALDFLRYVTAPERLAEQARWLPYGPVRLSALGKVGKHAQVDIEMMPYLPTAAENFRRALRFDSAWWDANERRIRPRFDAWRDGKPYDLSAFDADGIPPPDADDKQPQKDASPARQ